MTSETIENATARLSYRAAGVDIDAGDALVEAIKPLARATARAGVLGGLGGFGALFDLKAAGFVDPVLVSTTDGVGTKLMIAIETGIHDTVGIDLVAMCVNDLVVQGAEPLFFLDYFATGKLDPAAGARGDRRHRLGLQRGRLRPGRRRDRRDARAVPRRRLRPGRLRGRRGGARGAAAARRGAGRRGAGAGELRACIPTRSRWCGGWWRSADWPWTAPAPFAPEMSLGQALMTPTRIYVRSLLALHRAGLLKAAAHITGGGLPGNLPRVLPEGMVAVLEPVLVGAAGVRLAGAHRRRRAGRDAAGVQLRHRHGGRGGRGGRRDATLLRDQGESVTRIGHIEARAAEVDGRWRAASTLPCPAGRQVRGRAVDRAVL